MSTTYMPGAFTPTATAPAALHCADLEGEGREGPVVGPALRDGAGKEVRRVSHQVGRHEGAVRVAANGNLLGIRHLAQEERHDWKDCALEKGEERRRKACKNERNGWTHGEQGSHLQRRCRKETT